MKVPEKWTKTEGVLLLLTLVFVLCTTVLYFQNSAGEEKMNYVVRSESVHLLTEEEKNELAEGEESWLLEEPTADNPLNINTATLEELDLLPGIGEALAERIVNYRTEHGAFAAKEDIMDVKGIGEGIFSEIESVITVEEAAQ